MKYKISWGDIEDIKNNSIYFNIKESKIELSNPAFTFKFTTLKEDGELLFIGNLYTIKFDYYGVKYEGDGVILGKMPCEDNPDLIELKIRIDNSKPI